ncbi:MAG: extracellular solute-binding protein [Candidatus Levybacteria bacterium]|nr:extracellular solute-binding protein [Candidatus Levybacteria bacterium]
MDENTIFQSPSEIAKQPEVPVNSPLAHPPSKFFKIVKILLGIAVVSAVIFMLLNFVLPKFFQTKMNNITLTYWGLQEDELVVAPIIADFEKENPNIKITYFKQNIKEYRERLMARSNNGNGPDIFKFHNSWTAQLSDILSPLPQNVIAKEDFTASYYPVAKSDLIRNGAIYGVPLQIDTLNLYVNNDIFEAAGLTPPASWIDFMNYSRQLTVKDEDNKIKTAGAAMGTYGNITHAPDIISLLFVQNGVDLQNISSNLQAAADALTFYSSFALPPGNVWDDTMDQSIKAFASGSLAMYFGYSQDYAVIKSINPNLSFSIYPVPNLPGQNATIASYWAEGVDSKSKNQKEAFIFLKYLTRKEVTQKLFKGPYARIDLADSLRNSAIYPFAASAPFAVSSFFVDGTYDNGLNSKMNNHLNNAVDSILKGTSVEAAAETLSQGVAQVLQDYDR